MTEPTTPTGKRLLSQRFVRDIGPDILVIEAEARQQERERLFREHMAGWHLVNVDADRYTYTACPTCRMFEEPAL